MLFNDMSCYKSWEEAADFVNAATKHLIDLENIQFCYPPYPVLNEVASLLFYWKFP